MFLRKTVSVETGQPWEFVAVHKQEIAKLSLTNIASFCHVFNEECESVETFCQVHSMYIVPSWKLNCQHAESPANFVLSFLFAFWNFMLVNWQNWMEWSQFQRVWWRQFHRVGFVILTWCNLVQDVTLNFLYFLELRLICVTTPAGCVNISSFKLFNTATLTHVNSLFSYQMGRPRAKRAAPFSEELDNCFRVGQVPLVHLETRIYVSQEAQSALLPLNERSFCFVGFFVKLQISYSCWNLISFFLRKDKTFVLPNLSCSEGSHLSACCIIAASVLFHPWAQLAVVLTGEFHSRNTRLITRAT